MVGFACVALVSAHPSSGQNAPLPASVDQGSVFAEAQPSAREELSALVPAPLPVSAAMDAVAKGPFEVVPQVAVHQDPLSRIGLGVGVSPLGVGANAAIVLTEIFDARLSGNYFAFNNGRIEVDEFNVYGGLHLSSAGASLDFYPFNTPIRLSAGLMFYNQNHASAVMRIVPRTAFTMDAQEFYAGGTNSAPLLGYAALGFHSVRPAPTLTFGFGKFIPRSNRHWSFPSEFGVAFTGAPSLDLTFSGTVCTDQLLTECGSAAGTSTPVGSAFNSALQAKLASWRHSLKRAPFFPIASGGVSYSFNTPWQWTPRAKF
jgi:hypothetical protein